LRIRLSLTDQRPMQMPVLDGFSAAKAILASESTKDHPMIVALTANSSEYHREQSAASGFVAFLSKPLVRVPCLQHLSYRRSFDNLCAPISRRT
jgi:CheY-like chemotaxis protein